MSNVFSISFKNFWYFCFNIKFPININSNEELDNNKINNILKTNKNYKKNIFIGKKGDLIISSQAGIHRGQPQKKGYERMVLVIKYRDQDKDIILSSLNLISSKYQDYSKRDKEKLITKTIDYLEAQKNIMLSKSIIIESL